MAEALRQLLQITPSQEDYLEAIFHTVEAKGAARAKDVGAAMGVHGSSVTQALRALAQKNLINYAPYDVIRRTEDGLTVAKDVVKRHDTLAKFLHSVLGMEKEAADEGACRMEHAIDGEILDRLVRFVENYESNCRKVCSYRAETHSEGGK